MRKTTNREMKATAKEDDDEDDEGDDGYSE